jgi:hypothetical protein
MRCAMHCAMRCATHCAITNKESYMKSTDPGAMGTIAPGDVLGALASCVADCLASYATVY